MAETEQIQRHDRILEQIISSAEITAVTVLKSLENRVADLIGSGADRNSIQNTIRDSWRNWSTTVLNSMDQSTADTILLHSELGLAPAEPTEADLAQATALKSASLPVLMAPAESASTDILAAVAVGAVVGLSIPEQQQSARIRISGYLASVTDPKVTALQELYRTQIRSRNYEAARSTMERIRTAWGQTPVGVNLLAQSNTTTHDTIMDYDSVYNQWRTRSLGVTRWRYAGGISATTRDFCAAHANEVFTEAEARQLWSTETWAGKRPGDPFVVRGGYNCRHYWIPENKNIVGNLRNLQQ